jgi:hypothetical protein
MDANPTQARGSREHSLPALLAVLRDHCQPRNTSLFRR